MNESVVKREFDEWVELLRSTGNEAMLKDPYNVWIEAWSLAWMFSQKKDPAETGSTTPSVKET